MEAIFVSRCGSSLKTLVVPENKSEERAQTCSCVRGPACSEAGGLLLLLLGPGGDQLHQTGKGKSV